MMTFDDWMRSERVTYKATDDSVTDRLLRRCWDAAVAANCQRLARDVADLHMAQSINNQNHPSAWNDGVDAALEVIREA